MVELVWWDGSFSPDKSKTATFLWATSDGDILDFDAQGWQLMSARNVSDKMFDEIYNRFRAETITDPALVDRICNEINKQLEKHV